MSNRYPSLPDLALASSIRQRRPLSTLNQHENLLLHATQRLHRCGQEMFELMAQSPTVRATIDGQIQQHLGLEGAEVGFQVPESGEQLSNRFSLSEACAFLLKHPVNDYSALGAAQLWRMPAGHRLAALSVPQLLDQLKQLALRPAITEAWNRYWAGRAAGSPESRHTRAAQLYREHFEAAALWLRAQNIGKADALKPLLALIDPLEGKPSVDGQQLFTEQVLLCDASGHETVQPGAWVVTLDSEQPAAQLLYLPFKWPVWQVFTERTDMERWLLDHRLALFGGEDAKTTIGYRLQASPLTTGIEHWLSSLADAQWATIIAPFERPSMRQQVSQALVASDEQDQHRRSTHLFASPPDWQPDFVEDTEMDSLPPFGLLSAELEVSQRHAMIRLQRVAMEALFTDAPRWALLKEQLDVLKTQQQASRVAATAILGRRPLDTATLNTQYTALYTARQKGLRAEAKLQHLLGQISEEELQRLEKTLDHPLRSARDENACVATLCLSISHQSNGTTTVTTTELKGPLVIATAQALTSQDESLLLYWPGSAGGLRRFESRLALAQSLLKGPVDTQEPSVQLKEVSVDPYDYSLGSQQVRFDECAAQLRSDYALTPNGSVREVELEKLRLQTLEHLLVPIHEARDTAYLQIIEQSNSSHLAQNTPAWLRDQTALQRKQLKPLIRAILAALRNALLLFDQSLPARDRFVQQRIDTRLREDFTLHGPVSVQLDLPDSVSETLDTIPGGGPGTPMRRVAVPSPNRSRMSLEQLTLHNLDDMMRARMGFARVLITAGDSRDTATLNAGFTIAYINRLVSDLNLAKKYEEQIYATFRGLPDESTFRQQYRRETLIQPWRLKLQLQGRLAHMQNQLTDEALHLLNIAIDAESATAWGHVKLFAAHLVAGGPDTGDEQPITLSGISFIQDSLSGLTLLYMPDAVDHQVLRSYTSLEEARLGLFDLCRLDSQVKYVAGRAIKGSVNAHIQRIDSAHQARFDAMIGVGERWPVTTSLAAHQLDADMGRLIEANRNDARSNEDLALEKYALTSGTLLNGIKIALGLIPFIGTAVSLVDGTTSLYKAVESFRQGDNSHGIEQLASVFECLLMAAIDLLPIAAVSSIRADAARKLTQLHQNTFVTASNRTWMSLPSRSKARVLARFEGYVYEKPISLATIHPQQQGIYRQVYRHPEGDFIVVHGHVFQVEYDQAYRTLRLSGTRARTYKQPVGLDDLGQWDTHGALYGTLIDGGVAGGGNVIGQVADRMDPLWPMAIRGYLPRWWIDRAWRQHQALMARIIGSERSMTTSAAQTNGLMKRFHANDMSVIPQLEAALDNYNTIARNLYEDLTQIGQFVHGNRARQLALAKTDAAEGVCQIAQWRIKLNAEQYVMLDADLDAALVRLNDLPFDQTAARITQRDAVRRIRTQRFEYIKSMDVYIKQMNDWLPNVKGANRRILATATEVINRHFTESTRTHMKCNDLTDLIAHRKPGSDVTWHYLQGPMKNANAQLDRALYLHMNIFEAAPSPTQRNRILRYCTEVYNMYQRHMNSWTASAPQHFDDTYVALMRSELNTHRVRAEKAMTTQPTSVSKSGTKRVFETDDSLLLIGEASPSSALNTRRYTITGERGYQQIWEQDASGKFHLTNPPPIDAWKPRATDLDILRRNARERLQAIAAHQGRVEAYARQNMSPVDLEFMMTSEADRMNLIARHIDDLDPRNSLAHSLRDKADELIEYGRQLRLRKTLESQSPTEGHLDYLLTQTLSEKPVVDIRKIGTLEALGKRKDGRMDFLQEYEIRDLRAAIPKTLWYAHFHYESAAPKQFDSFVKAHLKMPTQRRHGLKWQEAQSSAEGVSTAIWRGNIGHPLAKRHFQNA